MGVATRLGTQSPPLYGQVVLSCLLTGSASLAAYFLVHRGPTRSGERAGPVSILSGLPDAILLSEGLFYAANAVFAVGAVLWLSRRLVPWSCWAAALGYNAVLALYLENQVQLTHTGHVAGNLLLIHALWYGFYAGEIRAADREGRFWRTPLYPGWVHELSVCYLGLFYGLSGVSKWLTSGPTGCRSNCGPACSETPTGPSPRS
jgi:hypothetical protein